MARHNFFLKLTFYGICGQEDMQEQNLTPPKITFAVNKYVYVQALKTKLTLQISKKLNLKS